MARSGSLGAVLAVLSFAGTCSAQESGRAGSPGSRQPALAESVDAQQGITTRQALVEHMWALAGDQTEGRGLGQPGLTAAIEYAEKALREVGTLPGYHCDAGLATYLQPVPIVRYQFGSGTWARIERADGTNSLVPGENMVVLVAGKDKRDVASATPVFIGYGISEPELGWDDYANVDVRNRLVFILAGGYDELPRGLREEYTDPRSGPVKIAAAVQDHGVAGAVVIPSADLFSQWELLADMYAEGTYVAANSPEYLPVPAVAFGRESLHDVFRGTAYDPVTREGTYASFPLVGVKIALHVDATRELVSSYNVLGLVRGSDPVHADELVVVSAHIDHLGIVDGEIHNGANDDASGSAIVLELARRIAARPTHRSVLFALFTAEEVGHYGSLHFLEQVGNLGREVVSSLNLEHMGRSEDGTLVATAAVDLLSRVHRVADRAGGQRLRVRRLEEGGGAISGSDSFSFLLHDIPLVIVGGGMFPEYHSPLDDVDRIDFDLLEDGVVIGEALVRAIGEVE